MNNKYNLLFSIILPAYNSSLYLKKCIASILSQTYSNWELLIVDDGSTDNTSAVVKEFCLVDKRIRLFKKTNEGQGVARNYALNHCNGDYITFVDSDDILDSNYLQDVYKLISKNMVDVLSTNYCSIYNGKKKLVSLCNKDEEYVDKDGSIYAEYLLTRGNIHGAPWAKFYKFSLIKENNIRFPDYRAREDVYFLQQVYCFSKTMIISNINGYMVTIRKDSTEGSGFKREFLHSIDSGILAIDLCKAYHKNIVDLAYYHHFLVTLNLAYEYALSKYRNGDVKKVIDSNLLSGMKYAKTRQQAKDANCFIHHLFAMRTILIKRKIIVKIVGFFKKKH